MKVLLIKTLPELGTAGAIVEVRDAYARNFLLPKGIAKAATTPVLAEAKRQSDRMASDQAASAKQVAQARAQLADATVNLAADANPQGRLFAAVKEGHVLEALTKEKGVRLTGVKIEGLPIKTVGRHVVTIRWPDAESTSMAIEVTHAHP